MGNDFIASLKQEICDHVCDFIPESYWIETELKWSFSILWGDLVNFKWLKNERTKNNKNSNLNNQIGSIGVGAVVETLFLYTNYSILDLNLKT